MHAEWYALSLTPRARDPGADLLRDGSYVDVLVIGAGPTGLGAAKRLNQLVRPVPARWGAAIADFAIRAE